MGELCMHQTGQNPLLKGEKTEDFRGMSRDRSSLGAPLMCMLPRRELMYLSMGFLFSGSFIKHLRYGNVLPFGLLGIVSKYNMAEAVCASCLVAGPAEILT